MEPEVFLVLAEIRTETMQPCHLRFLILSCLFFSAVEPVIMAETVILGR